MDEDEPVQTTRLVALRLSAQKPPIDDGRTQ
jgi:hypothetical protein